MAFIQSFLDTFDRANGAVGNGWLNATGQNIAANALSLVGGPTTPWASEVLIRPTSENALNQRVVMDTVGGGGSSNLYIALRQQSAGNAIVAGLSTVGRVEIYRVVGGALSALLANGASFTFNAATAYRMTATAEGNAPSVVTISIATVAAPGTVLSTCTFNETTTQFANAGAAGLFAFNGTRGIDSFTVLTDIPADIINATNAGFLYDAPVVVSGGTARGISSGKLCEFAFSGTACTLLFGTNNPQVDITYRVDGGQLRRVPVAAQIPLTIDYTQGAAHFVEVWADVLESSTNLWSAGNGYPFNGVTLSAGGALLSATLNPPGSIEFLGDSLTASVALLPGGFGVANQFSAINFPQQTAARLGLRPVVRGFGATGLNIGGSGGVPKCADNFPFVYAGQAYTPATMPRLVVLLLGTNDALQGVSSATFAPLYTAFVAQVKAARPGARIVCVVPPACAVFASAIQSAAATHGATFLNYGGTLALSSANSDFGSDNIHLSVGGSNRLANRLVSDTAPLLAGGSSLTVEEIVAGMERTGGTLNLLQTAVGDVPTATENAEATAIEILTTPANKLATTVSGAVTATNGGGGGGGSIVQILRVGDYPQTSTITPYQLTTGDTGRIELPLVGDRNEPLLFADDATVTFTMREKGDTGVVAPVAATLTTPDAAGVRYARVVLTVPDIGEYEATFSVGGVSYPLGRRIKISVKGRL